MENKRLIGLIKEATKKARQLPMGPLINYQPPGSMIIINPLIPTVANAPDGIKPPELK